jgi:hypothetical protein
VKLTITVTDDDTTTSAGTNATNAALGSQPAGADVHDGGPMPDVLRQMAAEVTAGRMPPPR